MGSDLEWQPLTMIRGHGLICHGEKLTRSFRVRLRTECGAALGSMLFFLFLIAVVLSILLYAFGSVVPPGNVGIRQVTFGPGRGFSPQGLSPGYHWSIPFHSTIHMVPQSIQIIHFHRNKALHPDSANSLEIKTSDGQVVDADVSLLYRMQRAAAETHGGPADLITNIGRSKQSWESHIKRIADDELRRALGKLNTGEFYDPHLREREVNTAYEGMNRNLAKYGITVEAVLLRRYTYRADRIDQVIFSKNLQVQEERLNAASSKFAEAKATLERVSAEWDAKIKTLQVEGENRSQVIRSEGELSEKKKRAEGDLAVAKARAEVDRLRASALSQSVGTEVYVAREMAPLLASLKGGVLSDVDPYDLEAWMRKLGYGKGGQ